MAAAPPNDARSEMKWPATAQSECAGVFVFSSHPDFEIGGAPLSSI
jgi:hypothetical protein